MAELVSKVIEELSSIIAGKTEQEARLVVGVEEEVERLTSNFEAIYAVLTQAEERQFQEATIKRWLDKLKDVSYDMDDVLDEWGTTILKSQVKGGEYASKLMRKVCSFIRSSCFYCSNVCLRHDIAHKIEELNKRLDDIAKEKNSFNFSPEKGTTQLERQITSSVIDVSEVRGRENDKETIINMLLSEKSQAPNLHIISIVGMGGIGKTTLAQIAYNDNNVKTYFDKRIWVCVSDPFDEIRIAKAILESLSRHATNLSTLESLLQEIQQLIVEKKFLLVLDDVWEEDFRKWKYLNDSLKGGPLGSKILVTTRKENVAIMLGCTDIVRLGVLSEDVCWSLFSQVAFSNRTDVNPEHLEDIGRKIVNRCKGLPLAVKTLGGLLRFRQTREEWESVWNSPMWELEEVEKGLFAPLLLSYCDLPFKLRQCFSYCAVFPKDYILEKDKLIKMWMAQGYFRSSQSVEIEMIGEKCFKSLAARSFFQDFEKNEDDGSIIRCKMHDMVHDFAQFLTNDECYSVEIDDVKESKMDSFSREARHLMIKLANFVSFPSSVDNFKKLRSLLVISSSFSMINEAPPNEIVIPSSFSMINEAPPNLFNQLSCIRTLNLSWYFIQKVPSNIGKLIHLRYIDLSRNNFVELPETICELYNLQTLDISFCDLRKLPHGLGKLVNLRHLNIYNYGHLGDFTMKGIERLSCLRELDVFVVKYGSGHDVETCNLWYLKILKNLRGHLEISNLGDVRNPNDARKAEIKSIKHLNSLTLNFSKRTEAGIVGDEEVIEALEPCPNLESLEIKNYRCISWWPNWIMRLTKLRSIVLCDCHNIQHMPPFGKLPSLEVLELVGMKGVKRVGEEFLGIKNDGSRSTKKDEGEMSSSPSDINIAFPKLKRLVFWEMKEWEEWGDEEINNKTTNISNIMPSLRSLSIGYCPKLKALPGYLFHLTTLKELTIGYNCPILAKRFKKEEGEDWPNISHIPNIQISNY